MSTKRSKVEGQKVGPKQHMIYSKREEEWLRRGLIYSLEGKDKKLE